MGSVFACGAAAAAGWEEPVKETLEKRGAGGEENAGCACCEAVAERWLAPRAAAINASRRNQE